MDLSDFSSISMLIFNIQDIIPSIMEKYGVLVYIVIFLVIFCETGLVFLPFLPGDSLLFLLGLLSAGNGINVVILLFVVFLAAVMGDSVNYKIGEFFGKTIVQRNLVNKKHIKATEIYYGKYGGKTIILARFVPYIRSFAPFVAGTVRMEYKSFLKFNVIGAGLWSALFIVLGFVVGSSEVFREKQDLLLLLILVVSIIMLFSMMINFMKNMKECSSE